MKLHSRENWTNWRLARAIMALSLAVAGGAAYGWPGQLDTTFGCASGTCTGIATTGIPVSTGQASANAVALQSDGKIVLGGYTGSSGTANFAVARFNPNGTLDSTFNGNGTSTVAVTASDDHANAIAIQGDGKIVAAGGGVNSNFVWNFALVRFNANGTQDTAFGSKMTTIGSTYNEAYAVAVDGAGNIVMAGKAGDTPSTDWGLVRYTSGGIIDATFGGTGKVRTAMPFTCSGGCVGQAQAIAFQSDGRMIVAGWSGPLGNADFVLARYNTNGTLDSTFGTNGIKVHAISVGNDEAFAVKVITLGDGTQRILAAGITNPTSTKANYAIARYTMSGAVDTAFGTNGVVTTSLSGGNDIAASVTVDGTGNVVVGGDYNDASGDFVVARYTPNGVADNTFGCTTPGSCVGWVRTGISGTDLGKGVAVQSDGKIVLGGTAAAGTTSAKFALVRYLGGSQVANTATQLAVASVNGGNPVTAGAGFSVVVESRNASGGPANVVGSTSVALTLTTGTGPLGGTTGCTIPAGTGSCTASGLTLTTAQTGAVLTASRTAGDSLTSGASGPFSVVAASPASLTLVSGAGQSASVNTNFASPLVAALRDSFGNGVANQSVAFTGPASGAGATFTGGGTSVSVNTDASGNANSGTVKANLTSGSYNVIASFGALPTVSYGLTNSKATSATTVVLTTGTTPAPVNTSLTFTATVTGGSGTPSGTVTFTADGSLTLCANVSLNASGQGSCTTQALTGGLHSITAQYGGNAAYNGSASSALSQTMSKTTPAVSITSSSPNPSTVNAAVTVHYAVTPSPSGPVSPTGNVTVGDGSASCTGTVAAAACSITFTSQGTKTLTASYAGDASFNTATSAGFVQTVNNVNATVALSASPSLVTVGQASTITATVSGSQGTPTGTVAVSGAGGSCTITLASGTGNCSLTTNTVGISQTITGNYSGNGTYGAAMGTTTLSVSNAVPTVQISANPTSIVVGGNTTISATVSGGAGTPTGTVSVSGAGGNCTITLSNGTGTCSLTASTSGPSQTVTGSYSGDAKYNSGSGSTSLTVNTTGAIVSLSANPTSVTIGGTSTITATVSGSQGTPTGTVGVSGAGGNCTITLSSGTGSCVLTASNAGANQSVTGNYSGNATYGAASGATTLTVNKANPTVTVTVNPTSINQGQTTTVTATVSGSVGTPTGTVSVSGAGGNCTVTLASGTGTCSLTGNTSGANQTITGSYGGDAKYNSGSDTATLTVNGAAAATVALSASPTTVQKGQASTITATVAGNQGTPSGTVAVSGAGGTCTITLSSGAGSCSLTTATVGDNQTITGGYGGNGTYPAANGTTTLTVTKVIPTVSVIVQPGSTTVNNAVQASATVSGGVGTPTGSVAVSGAGGFCTITLTNGTGTCTLMPTVSGNGQTVSAPYSGDTNYMSALDTTSLNVHGSSTSAILDVDLSGGSADALTDGVMVMRYLAGLRGSSLTNNALGSGATQTDPTAIANYLTSIIAQLDVDGDGVATAGNDGLLIMRYLMGFRGTALLEGAKSAGSNLQAVDIEANIAALIQ